jgi:hypothetical protein
VGERLDSIQHELEENIFKVAPNSEFSSSPHQLENKALHGMLHFEITSSSKLDSLEHSIEEKMLREDSLDNPQ